MKTELYIKELVKDKNVGAITSTSNPVVEKIIDKIYFKNAEIIVEYGPGNGVITRILLDNMQPNTSLYVFETNENFIDDLSKIKDSRLFIINDDAENAKSVLKNRYQIEKVDYIVSTIPFTLINNNKRMRIINNSFMLLRKKGRFITYQYSLLIYHLIKWRFKSVQWKFVLLNIPPAFIIYGVK